MSKDCLVSVLCTAYNHEEYIRDALESIVTQQTDFPFELLVNDDASTDGTAAIIREYAEKYPDIVRPFYQEKNLYSQDIDIYYAVFFPNARGKYVAFCEGDDYWTDPEKLQLQADWLDAHPDYSACVHNTMNYYCDTGTEQPYAARYSGDCDLGFADVVHGVGGVFHTSAVMARAELFRDMPEFCMVSERHGVGDHPRALLFAMRGKIRYIDRFMSVYRNNSTPTAWTSRLRENAFLVDRLTGAVDMYRAALPCVSGDERKLLEHTLLEYEWELMQARGDYADMKRGVYKEITEEKPMSQRLWLDLKLHFPRAYCAYMKKRGRESGIPEKLKNKYM